MIKYLTGFGNLVLIAFIVMAMIIGVAIFEYINLLRQLDKAQRQYSECMAKDIKYAR